MLDWLTISARDYPQKLALITPSQTLTYDALNRLAARFARALTQQHDISAGQHVGVLMSSHADTVALIHALMKIGAVLVPLNTRLTPDELRYQVTQARCALLIHDAAYTDKAHALNVPALVIDHLHDFPDDSPITRTLNLDAPQAIVFTSGTSGKPKGALLTYANQFYSATASAFRLGVLPDDRWLCCLPLFHVGGLAIVLRSAQYGTAIILHNGFEVDAVNNAIDTQSVSLVSLVPTMLYRLLETRATQPFPKTLRMILLGGAAATPDLVTRAQALGAPIATTYGLTEACSQVATQTPDMTQHKPASVGRAVPFASLRVVDNKGRDVPQGTIGEVWVSGATVMQGYYDDAEATRKALRVGWLRTGDMGYLDTDGDLWLVQRRSDLIVSGGENIYPAELESALRTHPAVQEACVVGIPSTEWGQQVVAAVVLHEKADEQTLTAFLRERLGGYKIPRRWLFVDALPLTASGKIARAEVAKLFADS